MEILAAPRGFVSHVSRSAEQSEKRRHEGQGFNQPVVIRWCSAATKKLSQWTPQSLMSVSAPVSWIWQRESARVRVKSATFLKARMTPCGLCICSLQSLNICIRPCLIVSNALLAWLSFRTNFVGARNNQISQGVQSCQSLLMFFFSNWLCRIFLFSFLFAFAFATQI